MQQEPADALERQPTKRIDEQKKDTPKMARIIPLAELSAMEDGEPIMAVRGTLTKVYPPNEGDNANGHWSFQNATLKDRTGNIKVKFKDVADQRHLQGKEVLLQCIKTDKGSFTGVKVKDDEYQGKTTRLIWVTPSADIGLAEDSPATNGHAVPPATAAEAGARHQAATASQQATQAPATAAQAATAVVQPQAVPQTPPMAAQLQAEAQPPSQQPGGGKASLAEVTGWANQIANIQLLAITKIETYVAPMVKAKFGIQLDSGAKHAWAMNLAMQLEIQEKASWKMPATEYALPKASNGHQPVQPEAEPPYEPGVDG